MRSERRRSHDSFRATLLKLAAKLDVGCEYQATWTDFLGRGQQGSFAVKAIWAAGSWARGAKDCGDLDLILDLAQVSGRIPPTHTVNRVVFKSPRDVRLYVGTPDKNSSLASFAEAVLIWSAESTDYETNITRVRVVENAGRFDRKTDRLPLRNEQMYASDLDELEKLVDMIKQGVLESTWLDAASLPPLQVNRWSRDAFEFLAHAKSSMGAKTFSLLPAVIDALSSESHGNGWKTAFDEKTVARTGGIEVRLGRPWPAVTHLDSIGTFELILAPHVTQRGPNGLWRIRRGNMHSLRQRFATAEAFVLEYDSKSFSEQEASRWYGLLTTIQLFRTKAEAERRKRWYERNWGSSKWSMRAVGGNDLLVLIGNADRVQLGKRRFAISREAFLDVPEERCAEVESIIVGHLNGRGAARKAMIDMAGAADQGVGEHFE